MVTDTTDRMILRKAKF